MKRLKEYLILPSATVYQAIEGIDNGELQILMVVDDSGHLIGSVSDGDVRRAILKGYDLNSSVSEVMNASPIYVEYGTSRENVVSIMHEALIHCVPVVDQEKRVVGLESDERLLWDGVEETTVVLMAGGLGMRLRPLTEQTPKPLLPVNGKPILERILERFLEQGFRNFYISVNYKSEMIVDHFGDGSKFDCNISYIHETKRLGTAGALSLLPRDELSDHLIVMNGDLLTTVDFRYLIDFHKKTASSASMCVRDYSIEVPYGVVTVNGHEFLEVKEKPAHQYFVNAGIYALKSDVLKCMPVNCYVDITDFFEQLKSNKESVSVFPMREKWLDIGNINEYKRANGERYEW